MEYKRLEDERTEDQNDSLEDLTVSLNDKPSNADVVVTGVTGEEDIVARENLFQYIDEDPFTSLSGKERIQIRGVSGEVCHACVDAGHLVKEPPSNNSEDLLGDEEAVKKPTKENGMEEPVENKPTAEEPAGNKIGEKEKCKEQPVEEPAIENAQTGNDANNRRSDLVDDYDEIDDGNGPEEGAPSLKEEEPEAQTNNQTSLHQTDKLDQTKSKSDSSDPSQEKKIGPGPEREREGQMSSKLSVTSLASGESAASFSFSADSLGEILDWIAFHQYLMRKR